MPQNLFGIAELAKSDFKHTGLFVYQHWRAFGIQVGR